MKRILFFGAVCSALFAQAQDRCGTSAKVQQMINTIPGFEAHYNQVRTQLHDGAAALLAAPPSAQQPTLVVTVPVVVHILYKNTVQNISDAQIASQMTVLNNDFRKLNSDFATVVPTVFQPYGADLEINFVMATVDPDGNATTGITRKSVPSSFVFDDDYYTTSGEPAWDPYEYLNIWVGNFTNGSLLGFAYPPAAAGYDFDGLCIDYDYFGTIGTVDAPYNKGRTATHEIGHYFGLEHPWGNDGSACNSVANSDGAADTPATSGPYYGCPDFPDNTNACTTSTNGSMFMNFMDYTNDACMAFFTTAQKAITQTAINGPRNSVLGLPTVVNNSKVRIYPNPATTTLTIEADQVEVTRAELYNLAGQLVKKQEANTTSQLNVDLQGLQAGTYLVRLYNGNKLLKSDKIIKQ